MGVMLILYIAGGIFLGVVALVLFAIYGPQFLNFIALRRDIREAKRVNENARRLRLEKTTWKGLPLPVGPKGHFIVDGVMMAKTDQRDLHRYPDVLQDRARDMGVELKIWSEEFSFKYEVHVEWDKRLPPKSKGTVQA